MSRYKQLSKEERFTIENMMANKVYEVPAEWAKAADLMGNSFAFETDKKYVLQCNGSAGTDMTLSFRQLSVFFYEKSAQNAFGKCPGNSFIFIL